MIYRASQLGYIAVGASDLHEWDRFLTETMGVQRADTNDDEAFYRMDEARFRIHVAKDARDDLLALGFVVDSEADLDGLAEHISRAGVEVVQGSDAEAAHRKVERLIRFTDPNGIAVEVAWGLELAETPFVPSRDITGFVTGDAGMGHAVLWSKDPETSVKFYCDILGMRLTDRVMEPQLGEVIFLHCNSRHHTVAFLTAPPGVRQHVHHVQLQYKSMDDVGKTFDLIPNPNLLTTLGKHTNDEALSFYMKGPSGFGFECGWGGKLIDDSTWTPTTYHEGTIWGHKFRGLAELGQ